MPVLSLDIEGQTSSPKRSQAIQLPVGLREGGQPGLAHPLAAQGGRFDHADRLFGSVAGAWANCLVASSDVKELTPEFFYAPDFLRNADGHALGTRQVGGLRAHLCCAPAACSACTAAANTLLSAGAMQG